MHVYKDHTALTAQYKKYTECTGINIVESIGNEQGVFVEEQSHIIKYNICP